MSKSSSDTAGLSLPKQFFVTRDRLDLESDWKILRLGDYNIYCAPGVGAIRLLPPAGSERGSAVILGWFSYRGNFYPNSTSNEIHTAETLEEIYPLLTGRFVVLQHEGSSLLCTPDPGGQLPVVYRTESGELGSTPRVLEWTEKLLPDPTVDATYRRADGTVWYPFGATPYAGIERLLPGQTVALNAGRAQLINRTPAVTSPLSVEQMHGLARDFVEAVGRVGQSMECHLTAGWDSRMVVSATLQTARRITYLTYLPAGATARVDSQVASRIAKRFELDHAVIPVQSPSTKDIEAWLARTSYCLRDSVTNLTRTIAQTYVDRYALAGVGGEVGRAFYWNKRDIDQHGLTPDALLARLGFEKTEVGLSRAEQWLSGYAGLSSTSILDRAYIDIRLGCWASAALCGHPVQKPTLSPFNSMAVYESMLALPEDYRLSGQFARDFIACGSQELARIPINRPSGVQRLRNLPRELARRLPKSTTALIKNRLLLNTPV
ncbi:MAG: hypothetical protein ABJ084_10845 [Halioglobus sp.]